MDRFQIFQILHLLNPHPREKYHQLRRGFYKGDELCRLLLYYQIFTETLTHKPLTSNITLYPSIQAEELCITTSKPKVINVICFPSVPP